MGLLKDRNCIITGASKGLGTRIAQRFWMEGASLFLAARSKSLLDDLVRSLPLREKQKAVVFPVDFCDPSSPVLVAKEAGAQLGWLHVLINNAAVQGPIGPCWTNNDSDWDDAMRINFLAPAALCRQCIPLMDKNVRAKIISISGGGAAAARANFTAYGSSKAALVRFSECLASEMRQMGVDVNCIAPGAMYTAMTEAILHAGPEIAGEKEYKDALQLKQQGIGKTDAAVELCLFLASSASDGITGKLISAVWDPWDKLEEHREELEKSDVYTLRRIVPQDRGFNF
jgi:NAD(P)-dependent dehydrogenase (short-subunit alcohol dehydrogenase family)